MSKTSKLRKVEPVILEKIEMKQVFKDILKRYGDDNRISIQLANSIDFLCSGGGERAGDKNPY